MDNKIEQNKAQNLNELKKQTDLAKNNIKDQTRCMNLIKKEGDETINKNDREPALKKYNKINLIYYAHHSFCKYCYIKKFDNVSLKPQYSFLANFFKDLDKRNRLKSQKQITKEKKLLCIIQLQNYIIISYKHILINTMIYQMLKKVKWTPNMILVN